MSRGTVILFVKAPRAGAVKTRLGREIGMGRAAAIFRHLTMQTIAEARKGPWRIRLAVDPASALSGWRALWPSDLPRIAQGRGDLGKRMARVLRAAPAGPALMIGADAPGLRARHLRDGFTALQGADAVFGPAEDGGFWLIGAARRNGADFSFDGVRWSSAFALADTLDCLPARMRVSMIGALRDIDEAADLSVFRPRSLAR